MMRLAASLPFDIAVAVGSLAAVLCLLAGVTPWWRAAVAACRAVWSLGKRLRTAAAGWAWTALWMVSWAVSWVLVRLRPRPGQHCGPAEPVTAAAPLPGPFLPAPRPADAAESMTPLGPDTATHALLPYTGQDWGWE
jgi:hypothetical protein